MRSRRGKQLIIRWKNRQTTTFLKGNKSGENHYCVVSPFFLRWILQRSNYKDSSRAPGRKFGDRGTTRETSIPVKRKKKIPENNNMRRKEKMVMQGCNRNWVNIMRGRRRKENLPMHIGAQGKSMTYGGEPMKPKPQNIQAKGKTRVGIDMRRFVSVNSVVIKFHTAREGEKGGLGDTLRGFGIQQKTTRIAVGKGKENHPEVEGTHRGPPLSRWEVSLNSVHGERKATRSSMGHG